MSQFNFIILPMSQDQIMFHSLILYDLCTYKNKKKRDYFNLFKVLISSRDKKN